MPATETKAGEAFPAPTRAALAAVSMTSAAQLMLELLLARIFSVTLYYHFGFLVVSLALFGLGAAGVAVTLRRSWLQPERLARTQAGHSIAFGLGVCLALWVVLSCRLPQEGGWPVLGKLSLVYLSAALPFYFGGVCLASAMAAWTHLAGRVYAWDLLGASAGCLLTLPLLDWLGGPPAVLLSGTLGSLAAVGFAKGRRQRTLAALAAAGVGVLSLVGVWTGCFRVPSAKAVDEQRVIFSQWNSFSRVTVTPTAEDFLWLNIDSDAATRIFSAAAWQGPQRANLRFSETKLAALAYEARPVRRALIIGPGGGADVAAALQKGVAEVLGVELNPIIVNDVMLDRFADYNGQLYRQAGVQIVVGEGRSVVRREKRGFDVIQATLVDTWAATSAGAFTLSENILYTVEAFEDYLEKLEPDGILSVTRWLRLPRREFARLVTLGAEALTRRQVSDRSGHFFVAADARMANLLLKKTPFRPEEIQALEQACHRDGLRVIYRPGQPADDHEIIVRLITSPRPELVWREHPFDLSPPTDDRPFFFYSTRPENFFSGLFARGSDTEPAVQILSSLLLLVTVLVLIFLLGPLLLLRGKELRRGSWRRLALLVFFAVLGTGFIGLEMAWMQQFILFLGHPVYALSVVLFVLLASTGIGSRLSQRVSAGRLRLHLVLAATAVVGLAALYGFALGPLFRLLVSWPFAARVVVSVWLLGLCGLCMGRLMPLGLRLLAGQGEGRLVPWAWGVNGAASVFGSVGAMVVSLNLGYTVTQVLAAAAYLLTIPLLLLGSKAKGSPESMLPS